MATGKHLGWLHTLARARPSLMMQTLPPATTILSLVWTVP